MFASCLLLALGLAACGGDDDSSSSNATTATHDAAASSASTSSGSNASAGVAVTIDNFKFSTKPVKAGESFQVENKDDTEHTFTSDDGKFDVKRARGQDGDGRRADRREPTSSTARSTRSMHGDARGQLSDQPISAGEVAADRGGLADGVGSAQRGTSFGTPPARGDRADERVPASVLERVVDEHVLGDRRERARRPGRPRGIRRRSRPPHGRRSGRARRRCSPTGCGRRRPAVARAGGTRGRPRARPAARLRSCRPRRRRRTGRARRRRRRAGTRRPAPSTRRWRRGRGHRLPGGSVPN